VWLPWPARELPLQSRHRGQLPPSGLTAIASLEGDAAAGETLFWAGGCASCHAAPGAEGEAKLLLSGGVRLASDFGTFIAPNISPDPDTGIGNWTIADFANAMLAGVSPKGEHYYPAFPYTLLHTDDGPGHCRPVRVPQHAAAKRCGLPAPSRSGSRST
jgi:mono/diheme cytochrome c family protein